MIREIIPNFFLAGAPKAGTTSLYHQLAQHPQIFMSPVKEPTYFAREARVENFVPEMQQRIRQQEVDVRQRIAEGASVSDSRWLVTRWEDYLQLFAGVRDEVAVGEASVCYLWSRTAAREIMALNPAAKFLLVLRHPAERAFSQYLHYLSDGHDPHSFTAHIRLGLQAGEELSVFHPFLEFGRYGAQMERLLEVVPREQVRVWLYEDTLQEPKQFLREVFEFLGVRTDVEVDTRRRYHTMEVPRALGVVQTLRRSAAWRAMRNHTPQLLRSKLKGLLYRRNGTLRMTAEERAFLVRYYKEDVRRLEHVIKRDLSGWMQ